MDRTILHAARDVAVSAVKAAGDITKQRFATYHQCEDKGAFGDVVTEVDHLAEQVIVEAIGHTFPEHLIRSEEAGQLGKESDWLWLVDPLDGTNNYVIGLPVFAVSITLLFKEQPVLGVIYEPMTDRLFISIKDEGFFCNGVQMRMKKKPQLQLQRATLGWIQGHLVQHDEQAVQLRQHLDLKCKRMLRVWAPTLVWCMLAKGDAEAIVLYNSEGEDLYSGVLMVQEAGGHVMDFQGRPFQGMCEEPYLIACHPDYTEEWLQIVKQGLRV